MFINGTDRLIYIKWEGVYLPVGCLTSDSFSESSETLDTTTRDNEGWQTSVPTTQSYSISFDGLIINTKFSGGDFSKVSYDRLTELKRNRTLIEWKTTDTVGTFVNTGKGHIIDLGDGANVDEFISFNALIKGYGKPNNNTEISFTLTDENGSIIQDGNNNDIIT